MYFARAGLCAAFSKPRINVGSLLAMVSLGRVGGTLRFLRHVPNAIGLRDCVCYLDNYQINPKLSKCFLQIILFSG